MPEEVGKPVIVESVVDGQVMRSQLEFTNALLNKRRMIRSVKNPLDKCTIVSIYPKVIEEVKHTIEPGRFKIPAGSLEDPAILVVGSSSWWKDIDIDQPMLEIPHSSIQIAESVIKDYCNGMLGCNMADSMPGLFFVLGSQSVMEIKLKFKSKLEEVHERQTTWYKILVRLADSLWARSNGNPLVICDDMRLAARSLNYNDKAWLKDFQISELVRCKFCGGMRNPLYPICPTCKAIDPEHPLAANIKFAV
jgi:hypothetical protein